MNNIITPAGRKVYLEILLSYLLKFKNEFDMWEIWVNTTNNQDLEYIEDINQKYEWIKLIKLNEPLSKIHCMDDIYKFWQFIDKENFYLRLDDDIVYIKEKSIKSMFDYRINNKNPFLVYGNVVNNQIIDSLRQKFIDYNFFIEYIDNGTLWKSPKIAYDLHTLFLQNPKKFEFLENYFFTDYPRISINAICFSGEDIPKENFLPDEEAYVSHILPHQYNRPNMILSNTLFVHYAFGPQRICNYYPSEQSLDSTNILEQYKQLSLQ